ncbi:hypothetical protein CW304_19300 [Bacillus sp. UFRGS-B20]|nr:hypothetical protein CW304_19300 [Bacillus sp. UFRGS-B20]
MANQSNEIHLFLSSYLPALILKGVPSISSSLIPFHTFITCMNAFYSLWIIITQCPINTDGQT